MKLKYPVAFLLLTLTACGGATRYTTNSRSGGFSETKLQEGVYRVHFKGNGRTGEERAADFALLRAAELAQKNGYGYFVILAEQTKSDQYISSGSGQSQTTGTINSSGNGYATYNATTYQSGDNTSTYYKPRSTLVIQCFKDKPKDAKTIIYAAADVQTNIRAKYKEPQGFMDHFRQKAVP